MSFRNIAALSGFIVLCGGVGAACGALLLVLTAPKRTA